MTKITTHKPVEYDAKFLKVNAGVRYWEDGTVNGVKDDEDKPAMPFASKVEGA